VVVGLRGCFQSNLAETAHVDLKCGRVLAPAWRQRRAGVGGNRAGAGFAKAGAGGGLPRVGGGGGGGHDGVIRPAPARSRRAAFTETCRMTLQIPTAIAVKVPIVPIAVVAGSAGRRALRHQAVVQQFRAVIESIVVRRVAARVGAGAGRVV